MMNKNMECSVKEYHEWHRDKDVEIVGFVNNPVGYPSILTRVTDENGHLVSCLLDFIPNANGDWDISESYHCDREDEPDMVGCYESCEEEWETEDSGS